VDSAVLSALVWACHWPCASLTKAARAVLTLPRSAVSWLTAPVPTLTSLRLSSEVRKAAALAHRSASGDAADAGAVTDGVVPLAGVLADEVLAVDPHPAASSARPQVMTASSHRAALFAMRRFISRDATRAASERTSPFRDHSSSSSGCRSDCFGSATESLTWWSAWRGVALAIPLDLPLVRAP
jgi:hypothetical protein